MPSLDTVRETDEVLRSVGVELINGDSVHEEVSEKLSVASFENDRLGATDKLLENVSVDSSVKDMVTDPVAGELRV